MERCSKCGCVIDINFVYYDSMGNALCHHCYEGEEVHDDVYKAWQFIDDLRVYGA